MISSFFKFEPPSPLKLIDDSRFYPDDGLQKQMCVMRAVLLEKLFIPQWHVWRVVEPAHKYQNANGCLMNVKHQKHRLKLTYPSMHQMMSTFDLLRVWMRLCTNAYKRGRVPTFQPGGHARKQEVRNKVTMMSESEAVGPVWSRSSTRPVILHPAGTSHVNKTPPETQSRITFSPKFPKCYFISVVQEVFISFIKESAVDWYILIKDMMRFFTLIHRCVSSVQ